MRNRNEPRIGMLAKSNDQLERIVELFCQFGGIDAKNGTNEHRHAFRHLRFYFFFRHCRSSLFNDGCLAPTDRHETFA